MSGVANMVRGISSIARLKTAIKELPLKIRAAVARDAKDILNARMRENFAAGQTVYDVARPLSVSGKALSIVKSGKTLSQLYFVAIGTILRVQLPTKYAKYLVGKYQIMPMSLPVAWRGELEKLVRDYRRTFAAEMAQ